MLSCHGLVTSVKQCVDVPCAQAGIQRGPLKSSFTRPVHSLASRPRCGKGHRCCRELHAASAIAAERNDRPRTVTNRRYASSSRHHELPSAHRLQRSGAALSLRIARALSPGRSTGASTPLAAPCRATKAKERARALRRARRIARPPNASHPSHGRRRRVCLRALPCREIRC